jgi:hypothetical protein
MDMKFVVALRLILNCPVFHGTLLHDNGGQGAQGERDSNDYEAFG